MALIDVPWSDSEVAVFTLIATDGPLARADIARSSGLSKATVLAVVERLRARGVIERVSTTETRRQPGPRPGLYRAVPSAAFGIGLEIHRGGVDVDVRGLGDVPLVRLTHPVTRHPVLDDVIAAVGLACDQAGVSAEEAAVVIASVGGGVDPQTGRLLSWDLPDWQGDLVHGLMDALHAPVELENETNLWAIAERQIGACRDQPDFMLLTLSTTNGVGGALVLGGEIRRGRMGLAGELGYLPVAVESGGDDRVAVARDFRTLVEGDAIRALSPAAADPVGLVRAASAEPASPVLQALSERIAHALAAVLVSVDPGAFVIAGDLGLAGGVELAGRVRDHLRAVFASLGVEPPEVVVSTAGDEPVHRGLTVLVQRRLREAVLAANGQVHPSDLNANGKAQPH